MKFKYQLHDGNVPFFTWIVLCVHAMSLRIIRFLRFARRVLIYLKRYIPIIFCIVLFEAIIIPVGVHLGKYSSWIDGLWDLRNFFFTSILISFVGGILQEENKRHKELVKQFDAYKTFMFESEQFLDRICLLLDVDSNGNQFLNEKHYKQFLSSVHSRINACSKNSVARINKLPIVQNSDFIYSTHQVKPRVYLIIVFERYLRAIDIMSQRIQQSQFIGRMDCAISQLDSIYEEVQMELIQIEADGEKYTKTQLLQFTECICRRIYPAIAAVRHPWRWDVEKNSAMDELLQK